MSEPYVGQIVFAAFGWAPRGYAWCNGTTMTIQQNQALYSLITTTYGGDGKTTFNLPDLRGRTPMGMGVSPVSGTSYPLGQYGGVEGVTLTAAQLPPHTHTVNVSSTIGTVPALSNISSTTGPNKSNPNPSLMYGPATSQGDLVALNTLTVSDVGGGGAHSNIQPFGVVNAMIATLGYYPQRP